VGDVFLLAFLAALYPTLLAATTVMLLLPHPKRLLLGYLGGAAMTSVTLGLIVVFTLRHAGLTKTTQATLGPGEDIALGCLALAIAFVVGALLTLPGATYITALYRISDENISDPLTVLTVLAFNAIMLMLLEIPLLAYTFAPDWTPKAIERFKHKLSERGRIWGIRIAATLGLLMIARGIITLLA
jgi:Sap, sulfolipid-1-addressing protein